MLELRMTRLRALMASGGITCQRLATEAHVGRADLNMAALGHRAPGPRFARKVADAVGWDGEPSELFEEVCLREVPDGAA